MNEAGTESSCNESSQVPVFEPAVGSTACCNFDGLHCAGCMDLSDDGSTCVTCAGGFIQNSTVGACQACMDFTWENKEGQNCYEISAESCGGEKFKGFSSNEACCHCGGGHRAATPFTYYVGPTVLGASEIVGHPVPRTGSKYSVNQECELVKYGLTIDASTGELKFAESCSGPNVGCEGSKATEAFTVSCTVTAEQEGPDALTASALLTVIAYQGFSYTSAYPRIFHDDVQTSYTPEIAGEVTQDSFQLSGCSPDVSGRVTLDANSGVLTLDANVDAASGVTGVDGVGATTGAVCYITATIDSVSSTVPVVVLWPEIWDALAYENHDSSTVLYATVGQRAPLLKPTVEEGKVPPSRFSAYHSDVSFDVLTGAGTYQGLLLFHLDVSTGYFRLEPSPALVDVLADFTTRAELALTITVFAHYEWPALATGPVKQMELMLSIRDSTCWVTQELSFSARQTLGSADSEGACKKLCRSDLQCTHMSFSDSVCYSYSRLCTGDCEYGTVDVVARYANCAERTSCVTISMNDHYYLSGEYCPYGESGDGQVFLKVGRTEQDSFWLTANDDSGSCDKDTYGSMLRTTDATHDFWNVSKNYVEHHGEVVACIGKTISQIVDTVFETSSSLVSWCSDGKLDDSGTYCCSFGCTQCTQQGCGSAGTVEGDVCCSQENECTTITEVGCKVPDTPLDLVTMASLSAPSCGAPNLTLAETIRSGSSATAEVSEVFGLILDDPATEVEADYWLHPCHCAPPDWGNNAPVSADAFAETPATTSNIFDAPPFQIVDGAFVCEQASLLNIYLAEDDPTAESFQPTDVHTCQVHCADEEEVTGEACYFFWFGTIGQSQQCWTFKACTTLFRRVGMSGQLMATPWGSKVCALANAELCWHVTKRREFLTASQPQTYPTCLHQSLFEQCDQKLMLGGTSVSGCGQCKYAPVPQDYPTWSTIADSEYHRRRRSGITLNVVEFGDALFEDNNNLMYGSTSGAGFSSANTVGSFLYGANCYYIQQDKQAFANESDAEVLTVTPPWDAVVYLQWYDAEDYVAMSHLRVEPFKRWPTYNDWSYVMNASNPLRPYRTMESMWFKQKVSAGEPVEFYGSDPGTNEEYLPPLIFFCPANIEATLSLSKSVMPSVFEHGSSLHARCWTERYRSKDSENYTAIAAEIRCVAGTWVNAEGTKGLANFERLERQLFGAISA
ncbi:unnamed protein product [Durusdinium trenchii]|uniref:Uncharacterized protein n=1 Tax=Durusdinium trenchii TaxID=1381693 RepID=A0ABP0K6P1_9DINO